MRKIRTGIFETNSSSVHCICIAKGEIDPLSIPTNISARFGEFGWESEYYWLDYEKLSYLCTMIFEVSPSKFEKLCDILARNGVMLRDLKMTGHEWYPLGYIDHGDDWVDTLDKLMDDEDMLMRFLFNDKSYVETGNDNDDTIPGGEDKEKYDVFWKGN